MLDINKVEREAREELQQEREDEAKEKLVAKLRELDRAEKVVQNIRNEMDILKREIGAAPLGGNSADSETE